MKRGFTVVELLVASLLLSMLVTMLTMMFNQSSIAWNIGAKNSSKVAGARECLGTYHDVEDDTLPGLGQTGVQQPGSRALNYRTVSLWKKNSGNNTLRTGRAFEQINWAGSSHSGFSDSAAQQGSTDSSPNASSGQGTGSGSSASSSSAGGYIVGVRSYGPDREPDTDDDITTFPEDID